MADSPHARAYYRLRYPLQARPQLRLGEREFTVTEISEQGCRILANLQDSILFGGNPTVLISFCNESSAHSQASFLRAENDELVLELNQPIPLNIIIAEQRWVIQKFPGSSQE